MVGPLAISTPTKYERCVGNKEALWVLKCDMCKVVLG